MKDSTAVVTTYVFLFILLLTALCALAANLELFGLDSDSNFARATLAGVLLEVAGALVIVWKTKGASQADVIAVIQFPEGIAAEDVSLDVSRCRFELLADGKVLKQGSANASFDVGGWVCRLPTPSDANQIVSLKLFDDAGSEWRVKPFYPLSKSVSAARAGNARRSS